ncbi:hypothetical protein ACVW05_002029 [Pseudomonas fulva]
MPHQVSRVFALGYVLHEATLAAGESLGHILCRPTYGLFCAVNFFGQEDNDRICKRHDLFKVNVVGSKYRMPGTYLLDQDAGFASDAVSW